MAQAACHALFEVTGDICPSLLNRILGLLAQLDLTPLELTLRRDEQEVSIRLVQDDLEPHRAEIVAEKMRSIVTVRSVALTLAC